MGGSVAVSRELPELLLREPRLTLAVAESVTAGHVQSRVAAVSGASGFFLGGVTAYSLEQKVKLLGVDQPSLPPLPLLPNPKPELGRPIERGAPPLR
jgi:nicotinamide mononucleotide (NMN) deamidase PncC